MRFRIIRLDPQRLLILRDRCRRLPLLEQQVPEVVVRLGVIGLQVQCGGEMDLGFIEPPSPSSRVARL